jgi:hypothetical protein
MNYERMLEGIHALYAAAGVDVPVSESGVAMPWHSLRHTFGTECAARGVPVPVIKELMGHSSIATTMRYVNRDEPASSMRPSGRRLGNRWATARPKSKTRNQALRPNSASSFE